MGNHANRVPGDLQNETLDIPVQKSKNGQILNLAVPWAAFQSREDVLNRSN
jgi:hypothetical protein